MAAPKSKYLRPVIKDWGDEASIQSRFRELVRGWELEKTLGSRTYWRRYGMAKHPYDNPEAAWLDEPLCSITEMGD